MYHSMDRITAGIWLCKQYETLAKQSRVLLIVRDQARRLSDTWWIRPPTSMQVRQQCTAQQLWTLLSIDGQPLCRKKSWSLVSADCPSIVYSMPEHANIKHGCIELQTNDMIAASFYKQQCNSCNQTTASSSDGVNFI